MANEKEETFTSNDSLLYLQLRVHGNRTFLENTLQWREIGFVIEVKGRQKEMVKKYFEINLIIWERPFGAIPGYVEEQFLRKAVIFLAMINTSAVVIAGMDVVLRPKPSGWMLR